MTTIALTDLEQDVRGILARVGLEHTIVITDGKREVAQITPPSEHRPYGLCEGEFVVPDDFNDPLPDDVLRAFHAL